MEKKQLLQNNNGFVGFYPNTHVPFYQLQVNIGSNKSYENFTVQQTVTINDDFIDTFNKTEEGEAIYIRVDIISDTIVSGENTPIFEGYKGSSGLYFTHTPISNPGKENERIYIRNFNITNIDIKAKTANVQFNQRILNNSIKFNTGSNEVTQYMGGTWNTYTFKKDDNNGNPVLVLISDFTNLPEVQSIESIHGYGIGGHGIIYRASNNKETAPIIQPFMIEAARYFESVGNGSSRLFTSLYDVQPVTVTYNSKEYVGLILRGSGSIINILGYGLSLLSEPIYINYIDNNTLPSNVVINDKSIFYEKLNLNSDRHNLLATSSSDGYMAQEDKVKVDKIITNSNGDKYLSDDGTYKAIEVGDKTNVLILSLENDLANGQKDSPVTAEVSTALKDAISTGKACVIKSANSDILANLQQTGNNVTIVMEQISRVSQTFVAVNTTITVNTSTNVISDYQTGAIVLETEGDGSKFLSDDGTYKEINTNNAYLLNADIFSKGSTGSIDSSIVQQLDNAINNKIPIYFYTPDADTNNNRFYPISVYQSSEDLSNNIILTYLISSTIIQNIIISRANNTYEIQSVFLITENDVLTKTNTTAYTPTASYHPATKKYVDDLVSWTANLMPSTRNLDLTDDTYTIDEIFNAINRKDYVFLTQITTMNINNTDVSFDVIIYKYNNSVSLDERYIIIAPDQIKVNNSIYNIKYIKNNTTTIRIQFTKIQQILTESEYAALGTTPNTNNVLYFITPD